jgi:nucleoside-diphosphate-sugar epimerase
MTETRVALLGASGFVGTAVRAALELSGAEVRVVPTPRLRTPLRSSGGLISAARREAAVREIAAQLDGIDVLINAAGCPDASSLDEDMLYGGNALLPRVALEAAGLAQVRRVVHVSSAVVQNDKSVLDESEELLPFSPYSASKVAGEEVLREQIPAGVSVVRYRPPSVHASGRRVTRMVARIAASPVASVARPGTQPTPQAQLPNVGSAVAFLATSPVQPPEVVIHPSEGVTTAGLMRDLSGGRREPLRLPKWLAVFLVAAAKLAGRLHRPTAANGRRLELLWLGQGQAESWLTGLGWIPPVGPEGWKRLGAAESGRAAS